MRNVMENFLNLIFTLLFICLPSGVVSTPRQAIWIRHSVTAEKRLHAIVNRFVSLGRRPAGTLNDCINGKRNR